MLFPKWPPGGVLTTWSHFPDSFRSAVALETEIARKAAGIDRLLAEGRQDVGPVMIKLGREAIVGEWIG